MYRHQSGPCAEFLIFCAPTYGGREVSPFFVGLPVELKLYGPVKEAFGMGVRAFATLSAEEQWGGLALELRLHPIRPDRSRAE